MAREMREATFTILTALADGPRHGYGVMTEVSELSGGSVQLLAGTLYAALERLRADDLIAVAREEIVQGRLRRFYALTESGTQTLLDEAERRRTMAQRALDRLRIAPSSPVAEA